MIKKVLVILPQDSFDNKAFLLLQNLLQQRKVQILTAGETREVVRSMSGEEFDPDLALDEIEIKEFDGLILISDINVGKQCGNPNIVRLIQNFKKSGKILGAVNGASAVLACAGALISKTATGDPNEQSYLVDKGAEYTGMQVVVDGNVVTAKDSTAINEFVDKLFLLLTS